MSQRAAARTISSPERPTASKSVAADGDPGGDRGGEKSGVATAPWRPIRGEEAEETAAKRSFAVDLSGEALCGGGTRRRRRRPSASRVRERGRGGRGICGRFCAKAPVIYAIFVRVPTFGKVRDCGFYFRFCEGFFAKTSRTRRAGRPIADGRLGSPAL